jgi:hypothetical protein
MLADGSWQELRAGAARCWQMGVGRSLEQARPDAGRLARHAAVGDGRMACEQGHTGSRRSGPQEKEKASQHSRLAGPDGTRLRSESRAGGQAWHTPIQGCHKRIGLTHARHRLDEAGGVLAYLRQMCSLPSRERREAGPISCSCSWAHMLLLKLGESRAADSTSSLAPQGPSRARRPRTPARW